MYKIFPVVLCFFCLSGCALFRPADGTIGNRSTPRGNGPDAHIRASITDHAAELLGVRYKYGGNTPREGFDCSGFVRYVYQNAGLEIARTSRDQATYGSRTNIQDAQPGDLVFYKRKNGKPVFHVSLVVDNTREKLWVIHSTSSRGVIKEDILASSYWRPKVYQVRNVIR
jgi:cell wall-associated NlpC family hydrolase